MPPLLDDDNCRRRRRRKPCERSSLDNDHRPPAIETDTHHSCDTRETDSIPRDEDTPRKQSWDNTAFSNEWLLPETPESTRRKRSQRSKWLIYPDHPLKVLWDVVTVTISLINAYLTHKAIRDRSFEDSAFVRFSEAWFICDVCLNFVTIQKRDGFAYDTLRAVWARYLTSWFVFDVLSLIPAEYMYVKPLFDKQKARNVLVKNFFRTKAVVRVTRVLRGRHIRLFGSVVRRTKPVGVGANRLLRLIIKYVPKYLLVYRNMKAVILVRCLRQLHWFRKLWRGLIGTEEKVEDDSTTTEEYDDDDSLCVVLDHVYNEFDDPDPF